jgi:hypothetical protein
MARVDSRSGDTELIQIPFKPFFIAMAGLFAFSYLFCILLDLTLPGFAMYPAWQALLPGFTWLSWPSFFLGLFETFLYGFYVAIIFVPTFNWLARRSDKG